MRACARIRDWFNFAGKFLSIVPLDKPEPSEWQQANLEGQASHERARSHSIENLQKPEGFSDVYEKWFDEVSKWLRALGAHEADRDDLVQEVFIIVHRRYKYFDGENLAGWLYQITRHKVRDFKRRRWVRHVLLMGNLHEDQTDAKCTSPLESLETREKRDLLLKLLASLNENERAALLLFEVEGYSGQQIADLQSVPLNTVWARIFKARQRLKLRLAAIEARESRATR